MESKRVTLRLMPLGRYDIFEVATRAGPQSAQVLKMILLQANGDIWHNDIPNREAISQALGISTITVKRYISRLYEHRFITRPTGTARGVYKVNLVGLNIQRIHKR